MWHTLHRRCGPPQAASRIGHTDALLGNESCGRSQRNIHSLLRDSICLTVVLSGMGYTTAVAADVMHYLFFYWPDKYFIADSVSVGAATHEPEPSVPLI